MATARRKSPPRSRPDRKKTGTKKPARKARAAARRWSQHVTEHSDALDLEKSVFAQKNPHRIALSLKRSAERSKRRKSEPYRSAMAMLVFYINRAGKGLPKRQVAILERAKGELRKAFGRV